MFQSSYNTIDKEQIIKINMKRENALSTDINTRNINIESNENFHQRFVSIGSKINSYVKKRKNGVNSRIAFSHGDDESFRQ